MVRVGGVAFMMQSPCVGMVLVVGIVVADKVVWKMVIVAARVLGGGGCFQFYLHD